MSLVGARLAVLPSVYLRAQGDLSHSWLSVSETSIFAHQRSAGAPEVRRLLDTAPRHWLFVLEAGVEYDNRDSELVTRAGSYHHLRVRYSPGLDGGAHRYGQLNLTVRHWRTIRGWRPWTVGARLVGDALVGSPPIYELTRIDDSSVVGGGTGIRGVPAQRYYGKIKLFANVEAHTELWRFWIGTKPFVLSPVLFVDGGRVWTDHGFHPELDGTGLGLKYGLGGGVRLQQGTTFVVRGNVAWSPDAEPVGVYFNAGQLF